MSDTSACTPPAEETPTPGRWQRNIIYVFAFLPPRGVLAFFMPRFGPIFEKLNEKGQLHLYNLWAWKGACFNEEYFYLPLVVVFVMLRTLAEYCILASPRAANRALCIGVWRFGIIFVGILLWLVCCTAPLLPVHMSKVR